MDFSGLAGFLDSLIDIGIPGVDALVMQNHEVLFRHKAGWRDRENGIPMRGNELYFIYSCSKVITVTAAMQLYEKGAFLLTDPVGDYIPEYRNLRVKDPAGGDHPARNPMLIRHLFTMTSGLNYDLNAPGIRKVREETGGACPTLEIARALAGQPLDFEPGEHWQYSLSHDVLAALVEAVSGERFSEYVQKHIFDPVGMSHSRYHMEPGTEDRFACQYRFDDERRQADRIELNAGYILGNEYDSGGAGVISSVEDCAKFLDTLACGGVTADGKQILSPAAIELMRTNQLGEAQLKDFNWVQMTGYGYGMGVRTVIDRAAGGVMSPVGEFGWGGAAGAYMLIDPVNHLSVYYGQHMLNNLEPYTHPRIRNILYGILSRKE